MKRYALFSLSKKSKEFVDLARILIDKGFSIIATEGTLRFLKENGINASSTSILTGFQSLMHEKVKTLNQLIHAMILCNRENKEELEQISNVGLIDLIALNFYETSFESLDEFLSSLDIGGRALVNSAIKNFKYVTIIIDEKDCIDIIKEIKEKNEITYETKKKLAIKAFEYLINYEARAFSYFYEKLTNDVSLFLFLKDGIKLKYGENPHQKAYFFKYSTDEQLEYEILKGELSYNNFLDLNRVICLLGDLGENHCAIIKHTSPCGVARGQNAKDAFLKAYSSDPQSAYGGVLGISSIIDKELAEIIYNYFFDLIIAKDFDEEAFKILNKKKKTRLIKVANLGIKLKKGYNIRDVVNGILIQERDLKDIEVHEMKFVSNKKPNQEEIKDALFAWKVVKHVFSNAIVVAKNEMTLGIGSGQPNRFYSTKIALEKASEKAKGAVLASDGFFPFRDSIDLAANKGITTIIEPGGSIRDNEIIDAANEHGIALIFTGIRCFRH
jgi:phosphoribosylaminoimidazolecarboxamide formyltransferase/IMP cyclohydrolase